MSRGTHPRAQSLSQSDSDTVTHVTPDRDPDCSLLPSIDERASDTIHAVREKHRITYKTKSKDKTRPGDRYNKAALTTRPRAAY